MWQKYQCTGTQDFRSELTFRGKLDFILKYHTTRADIVLHRSVIDLESCQRATSSSEPVSKNRKYHHSQIGINVACFPALSGHWCPTSPRARGGATGPWRSSALLPLPTISYGGRLWYLVLYVRCRPIERTTTEDLTRPVHQRPSHFGGLPRGTHPQATRRTGHQVKSKARKFPAL